LTAFKEVVIYAGELPGHLPGAHIMAFEEATHSRMPGRGEPITDEQRRDGVEATVIEAIHTGVPAVSVCQEAGLIEAFLGTLLGCLIGADLLLDILPMRTHIGPGVGQICSA